MAQDVAGADDRKVEVEVAHDPGAEPRGRRSLADLSKIRQTLNPLLSLYAALACL